VTEENMSYFKMFPVHEQEPEDSYFWVKSRNINALAWEKIFMTAKKNAMQRTLFTLIMVTLLQN